jgi:hypothetical protein
VPQSLCRTRAVTSKIALGAHDATGREYSRGRLLSLVRLLSDRLADAGLSTRTMRPLNPSLPTSRLGESTRSLSRRSRARDSQQPRPSSHRLRPGPHASIGAERPLFGRHCRGRLRGVKAGKMNFATAFATGGLRGRSRVHTAGHKPPRDVPAVATAAD